MYDTERTIESEIIQQLIKIADEIDNEFNNNQLEMNRRFGKLFQSNYVPFQCSITHRNLISINEQQQNQRNRIIKNSNKYFLVAAGVFCTYLVIKRYIK
ncbi:hypothetical protein MN116_005816 [Schistosoma mekongi]|uniref:Uncharacterized protein n=1 Tax=Schistosoma mekongi TaxID=38744 RepID=A0AAE2D3L9_SCHME|nr:hypothetical protein MN116_005816 [Schistosoma mekongi]